MSVGAGEQVSPGRIRVPRLLAPVGGAEALRAAVENGADEVYLAGQAWGARRFAENFDDAGMQAALTYAHVRGVAVLVTVNTLIKDHEMAAALDYVRKLHAWGADGVIVQDLGLGRAIRDLLPDLPVHVSTQATVHNSAGIRWWEDQGAKRIILAREMGSEEIGKLDYAPETELETFVHGSLCYCYSGQCLASSVLGGRSGNRGACAYTCRLPFDLEAGGKGPVSHEKVPRFENRSVIAKGVHALSAKDLQLVTELPLLAASGVASLKIEGRMKRPEYVAVTTAVHRAAIDRLAAGAFPVPQDELDSLRRVFNRDFTRGFTLDDAPVWELTNWSDPGNRGFPLGEVISSGKGFIKVRLTSELRVGDGIEVTHDPKRWAAWLAARGLDDRNPRGTGDQDTDQSGPEDWGWTVGLITLPDRGGREVGTANAGEVVELRGHQYARPGDAVFKSADFELLKEARRSFQGFKRKVPITIVAFAEPGQQLTATYCEVGRGISVTVSGPELAEPRSSPSEVETIRAQLGKLGESPFVAETIDVSIPAPVFVPVSQLKDLRRHGVAALQEAIATSYHRVTPSDWQDRRTSLLAPLDREDRLEVGPVGLTVRCWTLPILEAALSAGAREVAFSGSRVGGLRPTWDWDGLRSALRMVGEVAGKLWIDSGPIQHDWEVELLRSAVDEAKDHPAFAGILAGHHGALVVAKEFGVPAVADASLNTLNALTMVTLAESGVARVTTAVEMTGREVAEVAKHAPVPLEVLVHGRLTLMVSAYCTIGHATKCQKRDRAPCQDRPYHLKDAKGYRFPLVTDGACRMYLLNSVELNLLDRLGELKRAGVARVRIETIGSTPEAVRVQVRTYLDALERLNQEPGGWSHTQEEWEALARVNTSGFTRGLIDVGPL